MAQVQTPPKPISGIIIDDEEDVVDPSKVNVQKLREEALEGAEDADARDYSSRSNRIADRESEWQSKRRAWADSDAAGYKGKMKEMEDTREQNRVLKAVEEKRREDSERQSAASGSKRKSRWDVPPEGKTNGISRDSIGSSSKSTSEWDQEEKKPAPKRSRWDETPAGVGTTGATPRKRSRWDQTPVGMGTVAASMATPIGASAMSMATPIGNMGMMTPRTASVPMTPEMINNMRWEREMDFRNRPLTDEDLDAMLPSKGYKILQPPSGYVPVRTPSRKLMATPTPLPNSGFMFQDEASGMLVPPGQSLDIPKDIPGIGQLPTFKPEDVQFFGALVDGKDEAALTVDEVRERKIMRLLLKVKNGTPPMRKAALRQITDKARDFGPEALFGQILPLLRSPSLEDQERHLLVKVIDRVLYKLDDLVRPFVHRILVVIEPMLIDEDYYARVEGREIISNLSKAAGLATMIAAMRPDIDHPDEHVGEYVRNCTARAFSVVASALGIPALLPFLRAVCRTKKSWQARHTGIKVVQQIAILMGCAILPHLRSLVEAIAHGLEDENQKVRTIAALAVAALAEAAAPFGIESFDLVLQPLWLGVGKHRGKGLAAFLKAVGYIIPLMEPEHANIYTREVMIILIREFQTPEEEMKKIVLKVVKQCVSTEGVEAPYIKSEVLPEFFKNFWVRRMALDRRNGRMVVETTVEMGVKVGVAEIVGRLAEGLKDESEPYRKMVMETVEKVIEDGGAADIDERLEEVLVDGMLYAFHEQTMEDPIMLNGFGAVVNALGGRIRPYLQQICSTILWRLSNKSAKVRQQAADLIARIAVVMKNCGEEKLMGHLGVVLFEYLGEEYPEVLGSILGAMKAIVNVIGMSNMTPPIKDLLPRLTPILKNRHEKVQENCIAAGTNVTLADGTSLPIELVKPGMILASPRTSSTEVRRDLAALCTRVLDNGKRDCVTLVLEDGRRLVCTPDHRLLKSDGEWKSAADISLGTRLAVAPHISLSPKAAEDPNWSLNLDGITLSMSSEVESVKSITFARMTGYLLGSGSLFDTVGGPVAYFNLKTRAEAEAMARDMQRFGKLPTVHNPAPDTMVCFRVDASPILNKAFWSIPGVVAGKRVNELAPLPAFVTDPTTPVVFLREFLGGLFGSNGVVTRAVAETGSIDYAVSLKRACRKDVSHKEAMDSYMNTVKAAMRRVGVNVDGTRVCQTPGTLTSRSSEYSAGGECADTCLLIPSVISFAENVGFRYSLDEEMRLAAAISCLRIGSRDALSGIGCESWFDKNEDEIVGQMDNSTPVLNLSVVQRYGAGDHPVYDLTVPGNDAFFANGFAVHNCIDLVGRIADRGAEYVSAREWMRICFELLDMLKAHKKGIRRATVNTFGYIAKAIGPQDVLATLLNNLKVQERQNRVCTTVAIAIVSETCSPFTVLPALMNEYRVPELNVQNGVLKSLSFLFEYVGEMGKDYIYAVTPLLEDALMDRDLVHRQTACTTVKHLALGVFGLGCEDALLHLLNFVWPNIFETSPHVINAVMEAIDGIRVSIGACRILQYTLQGLFHPARKVREVYWKIYNSLYIGAQDQLVPFYPDIPSTNEKEYARDELLMVL